MNQVPFTLSPDFIRQALNRGDSRKIAEEAQELTARAREEADRIIKCMNLSAQEQVRALMVKREERRIAWQAQPFWKRLFTHPDTY